MLGPLMLDNSVISSRLSFLAMAPSMDLHVDGSTGFSEDPVFANGMMKISILLGTAA